MDIYSNARTSNLHEQKFAFIQVHEEGHVLHITLDRAEKKNALHPQMVNEIAYAMQYAHYQKNIWIILIKARGNVFCAGADLKAMMGLIEPNDSSIPQPDRPILIGELFNQVNKPTIAQVTGDVYAGGFFFLAGCNIVIAQDNVKFGLPEVKRGLFPFQVMTSLLNVMPPRKVLDWCIRGYNLPVKEAERYGLVTEAVPADRLEGVVHNIISNILENSPSAIRYGLEAYAKIRPAAEEHKYLMDMLQKTIGSKDGQEGLRAFKEKRMPVWTGE